MNQIQSKPLITLEATVVASQELVAANLDGEVVILGFKSGSYYSVDQVGAFVWDLLQQPQQVAAIRDAILNEYEIEQAQCEEDLLDLLADFAAKELIQVKAEVMA